MKITKSIMNQLVEKCYNQLESDFPNFAINCWSYIQTGKDLNFKKFKEKCYASVWENNHMEDVWGDSYLTIYGQDVNEHLYNFFEDLEKDLIRIGAL